MDSQNIMYTGLFIDEISAILEIFEPKHKQVYAHHSTIEFNPSNIENLEIGKKSKIKIIGRAFDEKGDALLVENPKSNNKYPHITLSCADKVSPVYSNELLEKAFLNKTIQFFNDPVYADVTEGYVNKDNQIIKDSQEMNKSSEQSLFNTIVLPTRPQPDTLVAIFILKKYGQEAFPGIYNAVIDVWQVFPKGETEESLAKKGILLLDFGDGKFDHHNKKIKTTSSNLVAEYLGIKDDPSLAKLLEYAERDDFYGKGTVSSDPIDRALGLSGLIAALNKTLQNNPEQIPGYIIPLIWAHHAEEYKRTKELPEEFEIAMQNGKADVFTVKQRKKNLRVIIIASDNASMPGYLRSQQGGRHDVVAQQISSGHVNILTRPTKRVDLRSLAAAIRLKEYGKHDTSNINMLNFSKTGKINEVPEWYFDPATNSLLNGGLNPKDISPTKILFSELKSVLEDGLSEKTWSPIQRFE